MTEVLNQSWIIVILVPLFILLSALKVLREDERGVVFLLGRFWKVKGPGVIIVIPVLMQMDRVDLRTRVLDVPEQDVISRDTVSVKVNAVVYFRAVDAQRAIIQVEDFMGATSQLAQTTLRSVLGQHELDEMLASREQLNADIHRILDEGTDAWGIEVSNVELKQVDLDDRMIRASAKQAEAERLRRAKVIDAEGGYQAAGILAQKEQAMQLRYLTTLQTIASDRGNAIAFPVPLDPIEGLTRSAPHRD